MADMSQVLESLQKEADEKQQALNNLRKLQERFPDLQRDVDRWKKVRYFARSVNAQVERFEIGHNCGCCPDSPLEIRPYIETELGRVYSGPPCFKVGEKHWMGGDKPYPNWQQNFRDAGIPEALIGAVAHHFRVCADERKQMAEESDYEDET